MSETPCKVNEYSSRVCERGTKSCVVEHGPQALIDRLWNELTQAKAELDKARIEVANRASFEQALMAERDTLRAECERLREDAAEKVLLLGVMKQTVQEP